MADESDKLGHLDNPRVWMVYDPTGENHGGLPTYIWGIEGQACGAPEGLKTRRQLARMGLRPNGQEPAGQIMFKPRGRRRAYLYRVDLAAPKLPMTPAKWESVRNATRSRYRCAECPRTDLDYIPKAGAPAWGRCFDCMGYPPNPAGS